MTSPRFAPLRGDQARAALSTWDALISELAEQLADVEVVINAAGNPDASISDETVLMAPNALLPAVVASAVHRAGVPRFVHVSSAVVQGRAAVLDQSAQVQPFSAYSRSKALGEQLVHEMAGQAAVVYRPPSVHAPDRRVSRVTARIARSPLSTVARPGSSPSPQALLANVADAIAFLATCETHPPTTVAHPSEGLTTATLLTFLGGRRPVELPHVFATAVVAALTASGRAVPAIAANARRVEMLWFGQGQAPSWLTAAGWTAPAGHDAWKELGRTLAEKP